MAVGTVGTDGRLSLIKQIKKDGKWVDVELTDEDREIIKELLKEMDIHRQKVEAESQVVNMAHLMQKTKVGFRQFAN